MDDDARRGIVGVKHSVEDDHPEWLVPLGTTRRSAARYQADMSSADNQPVNWTGPHGLVLQCRAISRPGSLDGPRPGRASSPTSDEDDRDCLGQVTNPLPPDEPTGEQHDRMQPDLFASGRGPSIGRVGDSAPEHAVVRRRAAGYSPINARSSASQRDDAITGCDQVGLDIRLRHALGRTETDVVFGTIERWTVCTSGAPVREQLASNGPSRSYADGSSAAAVDISRPTCRRIAVDATKRVKPPARTRVGPGAAAACRAGSYPMDRPSSSRTATLSPSAARRHQTDLRPCPARRSSEAGTGS